MIGTEGYDFVMRAKVLIPMGLENRKVLLSLELMRRDLTPQGVRRAGRILAVVSSSEVDRASICTAMDGG